METIDGKGIEQTASTDYPLASHHGWRDAHRVHLHPSCSGRLVQPARSGRRYSCRWHLGGCAMATTQAQHSADEEARMTPRLRWMRVMFAANVLGAGIPGFLVTFFPTFSAQVLFGGVIQDGLIFGVTGSLWFAIGLLSLCALRNPLPFVGIFAVQIIYKLVWIGVVGIPLSLAGDPRALPFTLFFALVVVGFGFALPLRYLLAADHIQEVFPIRPEQ